MKTAFFIAGKLKFKEKIAIITIAVSFIVMIVSVAISSGFRKEIRDGISNVTGDIQLSSADLNFINIDSPIDLRDSFLDSLSNISGVKKVLPVVYRAGIVKYNEQIQGVLLKGIDNSLDSMSISIPTKLAKNLNLKVGDRLLTYFVGEKVKARKFNIQSIYDGIVSDEDNLIVYARKDDMQRVNAWSENECSSIEIITDEGCKSAEALKDKAADISTLLLLGDNEQSNLIAQSSFQKFPQIYAWLDLIDTNVLVVLILMTIVAGFNMISGLLILLFRNISTIGILKAMGMKTKSIALIFLKASSDLVLKGMLIGNIIAFAFCLLEGYFHFLQLDPSNYFLSYVPVYLDLWKILLAECLSYFVIMVLLLIPCLFVSRVDPARSVRAQ